MTAFTIDLKLGSLYGCLHSETSVYFVKTSAGYILYSLGDIRCIFYINTASSVYYFYIFNVELT